MTEITDTHTHATAISGLVETETTTYLRTYCDVNIVTNGEIELPQYLITNAGALMEDFETVGDWTVAGAGASAAEDAVHYKSGSKSVQLTTGSGVQSTITKTVNLDLSIGNRFSLQIYIPDAIADFSNISIVLANDSSFTNSYVYSVPLGGLILASPAWHLLNFTKDMFTVNSGTPTWSSSFVRLRLRITPQSGKVLTPSFDTFKANLISVPAIMIGFDNNHATNYTGGYNYMKDHNVRATAFIVSDTIDTANYMTLAQITNLYNAGWTVANHTKTHPDLTTLTEAQQEAEFTDCKNYLNTNSLTDGSRYVAYPSGDWNADTITAMTASGMLIGRGVEYGTRKTFLPCYDIYHIEGRLFDDSLTTLAVAEGFIDTAITQGSILSCYFHAIDNGGSTWSTADFQAFIDYIVANDIQTITFDDFYKLEVGAIRVPAMI